MVSYLNKLVGKTFVNTVLILIVMDNGLLPTGNWGMCDGTAVLILIVMDNGLLQLLSVEVAESDYKS